ncbi:MAG: guanylate kinase [Actinobacteria bacterium 69-20]|nr:MAG: guanylate kinase [Actinobacteria bacterium 69-20]
MSGRSESASDVPGRRGRLYVVCGPSGVGKSTVLAALRRARPDLWFSVSVTTRPPRPGERNGVEYHFVDQRTYDRMVKGGELLEHATYAGHGYGTPREPVAERLAAGTDVLLEIELQGARQVRQAPGLGAEAVLVFLAPPSRAELVRRLTGRGTEDDPALTARLAAADAELAAEGEFDCTVVNTTVADAVDALVALMAA